MRKLSRKETLQWMLVASAGMTALDAAGQSGFYQDYKGYGADPNLIKGEIPWDLVMTKEQLETAHTLCEIMIPKDDHSPSASDVGVPEFINEWISAPYPEQANHKKPVLELLDWLEKISEEKFHLKFTALSQSQKEELCDMICYPEKTPQEWKAHSSQFALFRRLTGGAFYTTPEGMKDLKYMGNVPQLKFEGPPPEVLRKLGL